MPIPLRGGHQSHNDLQIHCPWKISSNGMPLTRPSPWQSVPRYSKIKGRILSLLMFIYCHLVVSLAFLCLIKTQLYLSCSWEISWGARTPSHFIIWMLFIYKVFHDFLSQEKNSTSLWFYWIESLGWNYSKNQDDSFAASRIYCWALAQQCGSHAALKTSFHFLVLPFGHLKDRKNNYALYMAKKFLQLMRLLICRFVTNTHNH